MDFTAFFKEIFANEPLLHLFQAMNSMSIAIAILLTLMSIITWYVIIWKFIQFLSIFYTARAWRQFLAAQIKQNHSDTPLPRHFFTNIWASVFQKIQLTLAAYPPEILNSEWIGRTLRIELQREKIRLETGLNGLASIGNNAPFLGLLGTVLEIYNVLKGLGGNSAVRLEMIAPPIGNALILTALGLAVAIPAALGYNGLLRLHRVLLQRLDNFAHQLHIYLILKGFNRHEWR